MSKKLDPWVITGGNMPESYNMPLLWGGRGSWGGGGNNKPDNSSGLPPWLGGDGTGYGGQAPASAQWKFPQYSQSWAFTPPTPTPYVLPPAFDRESDTGYATPTTSGSALSLSSLMAKYK